LKSLAEDEKKLLRDTEGAEHTLPLEEAGMGGVESASSQGEGDGESAAGFLPEHKNMLELIYGVLFDPVKTFQCMAEAPPIGQALFIFTLVSVLGAVIGHYLSSSVFPGWFYDEMGPLAGVAGAIIPLMALAGFIISFVKWIVYSGLLHLVAEMFGGKGRALGVLAVTGLATLPVILLMPFELVVALAWGQALMAAIIMGLLGLVALVWGFILLVLGLREVHGLSTGRALAVAVTPPLGIIILLLIFLLGLAASFGGLLRH
jgi:hypothetical protein